MVSETDRTVIGAIIPAAGSGSRIGAHVPKQFLELDGVPILVKTAEPFLQINDIRHIVIVLPADYRGAAEHLFHVHFSTGS